MDGEKIELRDYSMEGREGKTKEGRGEKRTHKLRVENKVRASSNRVSVRGGQKRYTHYCCKPEKC